MTSYVPADRRRAVWAMCCLFWSALRRRNVLSPLSRDGSGSVKRSEGGMRIKDVEGGLSARLLRVI